jgi:hypothetical protein
MQRVAVGWLAWTLTHSGAWLGIISMAEFFPVVFLSPLAGALADRRDRVGIIRVSQIAGSIEATLLAVLVYTGAITIELLFALTLLLGVFNAVAQPSRLALIPTLVDRAALPSALAINAIIFNSARFLGPAVAGIVIAKVSVGGLCGQCRNLHRVSRRDGQFARHPGIAGRRNPERPQGLGRSLWLCQPSSRHRADAAAVHDHAGRAVLSSCFPGLPIASLGADRKVWRP